MVHRSRRITIVLIAFEHLNDVLFGEFGH
jgi:hypothetical protein